MSIITRIAAPFSGNSLQTSHDIADGILNCLARALIEFKGSANYTLSEASGKLFTETPLLNG